MAETSQEYKLAEKTNETDPIVKFEPKFDPTIIAKPWVPEDRTEEGADLPSGPIQKTDSTRVDGVLIPIININTMVIKNEDLVYFKMTYTDFRPHVEIHVRNSGYAKLETPGMANKITVVMIPPVDKTYRKIKVDFYITTFQDFGDTLIYSGPMFYPDLEKKSTKAIKKDGSNKLSTYQLCYSLAAELLLGFAATKQCEEISDTKIRLSRGQSAEDIIQEHTSFGGLDKDSIFMSWVDVYGYLVLCNVAWVLGQATNINELSMHTLEGLNITDGSSEPENSIKYGENTFRTFTNWKANATKQSNTIATYEWVVNNYGIKSNGTNNTFYTINHKVAGGTNNIETQNITIEDKSADGQNYKDAYNFQDVQYLGVEMASKDDGNTPILYQTKRREAFLSQIFSKQLKVVLHDFNINLERGSLINIQIFEYDRPLKVKMLELSGNLKEKGDTETTLTEKDEIEEIDKILDNPKIGVPNFSVSGIYFISGIEYEYFQGEEKIRQTLYLIKQTPSNNYSNMSSLPKIKVPNS